MNFSVPRIQNQNVETQRYFDQLSQAVSQLGSVSLLDGVLLEGIELSSGDNSVSHKLGRKLRGWIITRKRASATVYDKQDSNTNPNKTLTLNASAAVSVDLWVF